MRPTFEHGPESGPLGETELCSLLASDSPREVVVTEPVGNDEVTISFEDALVAGPVPIGKLRDAHDVQRQWEVFEYKSLTSGCKLDLLRFP